ncbi:LysE family translocator [Pseudomonas sp. RP23018S]|uniref:LysE family translocator n=1 Tax=Pseudomonas sp. RP23018S TaxID=3096037 RepID=UPI002ACA10E6|nr:LysE family translocator [Pseudomonas sp. RP23018S]MDZ5603808.1 LysE family translocator [Pseudomonas sp. RP23018S]
MPDTLLPFALFALAASISPGPTNLLILAHAAQRGWRASLLPVLAACSAAAGIVLVVGLGLGDWLLGQPQVQRALGWLGVAWLSWLALQMLRSADTPVQQAQARRFGPGAAAALQVLNPKVWWMAVAVIGVFASPTRPIWLLALVFLLVALPCMATWAWLGARSARWLQAPGTVRALHRALAGLLLVSAWLSLL